MNRENICTSAYGIKAPIIKEGDNLSDIVVDSVLNATAIYSNSDANHDGNVIAYDIENTDIIAVTESVVARSLGNYATIDDIAKDVKEKFWGNNLTLVNMIYSRNRFAMILRGIARGITGGKMYLYMPPVDEVGNVSKNHPFTGMDYTKYYKEIVESEGVECIIVEDNLNPRNEHPTNVLYCGLHDYTQFKGVYSGFKYWYTLADILSDRCDWGVLGSNKSTEEKIKLFPNIRDCVNICENIKRKIENKTGKNVLVAIYGDGCFHSPMINGIIGTSINEFADPVTMPGYSDEETFESTPNEIKIKAFADDKYHDLSGFELEKAIRNEINTNTKMHNTLIGNMASQGTTPRKIRDLVASLCDLISGSGQKGTPIVMVKGYFDNYATD